MRRILGSTTKSNGGGLLGVRWQPKGDTAFKLFARAGSAKAPSPLRFAGALHRVVHPRCARAHGPWMLNLGISLKVGWWMLNVSCLYSSKHERVLTQRSTPT